MTFHWPEARDLSAADIRPAHRLRESNDIIGQREAIDRRYEEDGYLFFRGLLDGDCIAEARRRMTAPLLAEGLVSVEGERVRWIGGDRPSISEESGAFSGLSQFIIEHPANRAAFEMILGEAVCPVPMVQYRAYKPGNALGGVHQDGYYSPGISGYRPVWIPLSPIDEDVGGLTLVPGRNREGWFHNAARPPKCSIPEGALPEDSWAWIDYRPGDVVVIHPGTPHVGLPNRSQYVRMSIDARVQSAARPSTIVGTVTELTDAAVTLACKDGQARRLTYGEDTFIRIGENLGRRMPLEEFRDQAKVGMPLLASMEGDHALMIRRPQMG